LIIEVFDQIITGILQKKLEKMLLFKNIIFYFFLLLTLMRLNENMETTLCIVTFGMVRQINFAGVSGRLKIEFSGNLCSNLSRLEYILMVWFSTHREQLLSQRRDTFCMEILF